MVVYCNNALARGGCELTINEGVLVESVKNEQFTLLCAQPHVVDDTAHASDLVALNWEGLRKEKAEGGRGERERERERVRERERDEYCITLSWVSTYA